eukprot:CAMPEP_0170540396 /NCGR_PEP_ID=MMETSP0211-20121228/397_1 /TAXON_ID=311385 /ORGANISM="Pseudokeronopsis sp., Strain OXSARD2" /LENGTH=74 /DNA_ID=CAMNT_0010842783 /DNA_START=209 /DNA_END=430 /DNA_ORIENTATION=-
MIFYFAKSGKEGETIFANYLDIEMVKEILTGNNFFTQDEIDKLIDSDESRFKKYYMANDEGAGEEAEGEGEGDL